jgi:hypothetical protein
MDPGLMRLALRNLLSNALHHSPPQRSVTLRIGDSDEPLALVIEVICRAGVSNGPPPDPQARRCACGWRKADERRRAAPGRCQA